MLGCMTVDVQIIASDAARQQRYKLFLCTFKRKGHAVQFSLSIETVTRLSLNMV